MNNVDSDYKKFETDAYCNLLKRFWPSSLGKRPNKTMLKKTIKQLAAKKEMSRRGLAP